MNYLLLDLFVHGQGWIPSINIPYGSSDHPIVIEYNGEEYICDNPSILRWVSNDIDTIVVPESVFDEVIGDSPSRLPTSKIDTSGRRKIFDDILSIDTLDQSLSPKSKALDLLVASLLLNYIGVYNLAWKLQGDIYRLRDHLPGQWKSLGGITLNTHNEKMRKWNGDPSPFMKSNFNGMYVPYGLSEMASPRFILHEEVLHHSEMHIIHGSLLIQDLSFGIIPSISDISPDLLHAISIIGTGRDIMHIAHESRSPEIQIEESIPVICEISHDNIICTSSSDITPRGIREDMSVQEVISHIQSDDSLISPILAVIPIDTIREVADNLIDTMPIQSIIRSWDLFSFSPDSKRDKYISPHLVKIIESDERIETMEDMDEDALVSVANGLNIPVPYEDDEISVSQLINLIEEKLSILL